MTGNKGKKVGNNAASNHKPNQNNDHSHTRNTRNSDNNVNKKVTQQNIENVNPSRPTSLGSQESCAPRNKKVTQQNPENVNPSRLSLGNQDSSAPAIGDPCIECKLVIGEQDEAQMCDCCDQWYCYNCSQMVSKSIYQTLAQSTREDGIMWYCRHCRISFPGMKKTVEKVAELEANQKDIVSRLDKLENGGIESAIKDALEEKQNIENRKLNLICFGLEESQKNGADESREDDQITIDYLFKEILQLEDVVFKDRPIRLGRYNADKNCPVKLILNSVESKQTVLKSAREKLKDSENGNFAAVFIQSDLTPKQRHEAYLKRKERRERQRRERQMIETEHLV